MSTHRVDGKRPHIEKHVEKPQVAPSHTEKHTEKSTTKPANTLKQALEHGRSSFKPAKPDLLKLQSGGGPTAQVQSKAQTFRAPEGVAFVSADAAQHAASNNAVHESARAVETAYAHGGAPAAAAKLEEEAKKLNDPAQVDALIHEARPTIDKISNDLGRRVKENDDDGDSDGHATQTSIDHLTAVADLASDAGVKDIAQSLGGGLQSNLGEDRGDINQFDDAFEHLADDGKGARLAGALAVELINNRGMADAGNEILNEASNAVDKTRERYNEARGEMSQLEARLAGDLAAFGPGLTQEQRDKYIEAFWNTPERKEVKEKAEGLADQLSTQLETTGPALETLAAQGDSDAAQALLDGYEALAQSDEHAAESIAFVGRVNNNGQLAQVIDDNTDGNLEDRLGEKILAPALPRAQAQIFGAHQAEGPAGADNAARDLKALLDPIKAGAKYVKLAKSVAKLGDTIEKLSAADYDGAKAILEGWDDSSKLGKALKVAAVAQGVYTGVQKFEDGDITGGLRDFIKSTKGGLEVTAGLLGTFGRAESAAKVAGFAAKAAPYLGLAIDGLQLADDIHNLTTDGADAGEVVSIIGTGVSLAGDVLNATGVGEVIGVPLNVIGGVIHAVGGFISSIINGNEEREELQQDRQQLLEATGIDQHTRELLSFYPEQAAEIGTFGLNREQFLGELQRLRDDFDGGDSSNVEARMNGYRAAALFGLKGDEALRFAQMFTEQDPSAMYSVQSALNFAIPLDPSEVDANYLHDQQQQILAVMRVNFPPEAYAAFNLENRRGEDFNAAYFSIAQAV